jgi:predicted transcriptional regulator of viral defense system
MNEKEIKDIFVQNGELLKTSELYRFGVSKYEVKKYTELGLLDRITQGYYKLSASDISDAKLISLMIPEAVLTFDSALFYYGYSDRIPQKWHLAVDKDISKAKVRIDYPFIKPYYIECKLLNIGVESVTVDDSKMNIFSRDRLICECLKYEGKMDIETINKAIINYIEDPKKNISKLMDYAEIRGVTKKVYDKIGIWL